MLDSRIALLNSEIPDDPPAGFVPIPMGTGFNVLMGPLFARVIDGRVRIGMRIGRRHINPHDTCHGGILASFADIQVYAAQFDPRLKNTLLPTMHLGIDFLAPVLLGDWMEADTDLLRVSKTAVFLQSVGRVDGKPVFRSSGIYKLSGGTPPEGSTLGALFDDLAPG